MSNRCQGNEGEKKKRRRKKGSLQRKEELAGGESRIESRKNECVWYGLSDNEHKEGGFN